MATSHPRAALAVAAVVTAVGAAAAWYYAREGLTLSHYDARAHLVVARRIFDSLMPGWQQIGGVWLPLPHLLNALPVQVDMLYHYLPKGVARALSTFVDIVRIGFFAYACWLLWRYVGIVADERMVTIDLPRGIVFYGVLAAFVLMLVRAIQVAIANWRRGYSVLERPEMFDSFGELL